MKQSEALLYCFLVLCLAWTYEDLFIHFDPLGILKDITLTGIAVFMLRRTLK